MGPAAVLFASRLSRPYACRVALLGAALLGHAAVATSQALPSWSLRWDAPAVCPGPAAVRARVATLVGAAAQREARVRWDVTVRPDGTGFVAAVRAENEGTASSQTLSAPRCEELAETAALLLAWTVQPDGAPAPPPPPPAPPAPRASPRPSPRWASVGLGLRVDGGLAPSVAVGPSIALSLGASRWALRLDAAWLPPQDAPFDARRGGRFEAWTGSLSVCARWGRGRWRAGPCAGVEAGAIRAEGYGVSDPASTWEPWIAARGGGALDLALWGPVHLALAVAARVPLRRAAFVLEGVGAVHQSAAVGVAGDLAVDVHF